MNEKVSGYVDACESPRLREGGAKRYRLIDLFCGAGGFTLGFTGNNHLEFESVWANDINPYAVATYNRNFGTHCVQGDLVSLLANPEVRIPSADVVIGGPPCQGFSLLNRNREDDIRNNLWMPFLQVVSRSGAGVFVIENVPQLLGSPQGKEILEKATEMGFTCVYGKLNAADYGVAQTRMRAFIIGCRFADPGEYFPPIKTHFNPNAGNEAGHENGFVESPLPWRVVRDAIGDLQEPEGTSIRCEEPPLDLHFGRAPTALSLERYKVVAEEGMNRFDLQDKAPQLTPKCWLKKKSGGTDLFGRLWWNRPAVTIRTEFFKPEKGRYLHPSQHRPITHREAARFQSFPDEFRFEGSKQEIARQIGNAVPPMLAARIAEIVKTLLDRRLSEAQSG